MDTVSVKFLDQSNCKLDCDSGILHELSDMFSYFIPSAKFHPKFKSKKWLFISSLILIQSLF